jgi:hypothetical protein
MTAPDIARQPGARHEPKGVKASLSGVDWQYVEAIKAVGE